MKIGAYLSWTHNCRFKWPQRKSITVYASLNVECSFLWLFYYSHRKVNRLPTSRRVWLLGTICPHIVLNSICFREVMGQHMKETHRKSKESHHWRNGKFLLARSRSAWHWTQNQLWCSKFLCLYVQCWASEDAELHWSSGKKPLQRLFRARDRTCWDSWRARNPWLVPWRCKHANQSKQSHKFWLCWGDWAVYG